jgi:uncharacterized protein
VKTESVLAELPEEECHTLLARAHFGRVAFVDDGRAIVLPVNYVFDPPHVVFRSTTGSKLDAARRGSDVTFEVDATDPIYQGGWSVLAHGDLEVVDEPDEIARLETLPLRPWWRDARDQWLRIRVREITGRRLRQA